MIFGIKENNFDPYNVFLAIATHTPASEDWFCAPASHIHIYIYTKLIISLYNKKKRMYLRVHGSPGELAVNVCVSVWEQRGEMERWRQTMFITKLRRTHPMMLFGFYQISFRAHNHTRDPAVHVVLLQRNKTQRVWSGQPLNKKTNTVKTVILFISMSYINLAQLKVHVSQTGFRRNK